MGTGVLPRSEELMLLRYASITSVIVGWFILMGLRGSLAVLMMVAGIVGVVWAAAQDFKLRVEEKGLVDMLPAGLRDVTMDRSIMEILRPVVPWVDTTMFVQTGGMFVVSGILAFIDESKYQDFLSKLPGDLQRLLKRRGGIYHMLPSVVQKHMLPKRRLLTSHSAGPSRSAVTPLNPPTVKNPHSLLHDEKHGTKLADAPLESKEAKTPPYSQDVFDLATEPIYTYGETVNVVDEKKTSWSHASKILYSRRNCEETRSAVLNLFRRFGDELYEPVENALFDVAWITMTRISYRIYKNINGRRLQKILFWTALILLGLKLLLRRSSRMLIASK